MFWSPEFVSIFEIRDNPLVIPASSYRLPVTEGDFIKILRVNRVKLENRIGFPIPPVDKIPLV